MITTRTMTGTMTGTMIEDIGQPGITRMEGNGAET